MTKAYKEVGLKLLEEGEWITNPRTGVKCLTIDNILTTYDVGKGEFPISSTRKGFWLASIAEMVGYMQGLTNAEDFARLGSPTWFGNANDNEAWLNNPYRKGENDMGLVYGAVGNNVPKLDDTGTVIDTIDRLQVIVDHLKNNIDDRGEIWEFWMPGMFHMGCLRPCMYNHQFTLINGKLKLTSIQRSNDYCLGNRFNSIQVYFLLAVMAHLTGHKPDKAHHLSVNLHLYEDQYELFKEEMSRPVLSNPNLKFTISDKLTSLEQLRSIKTKEELKEYFNLEGYEHYGAPIKYPFQA